MKTIYSPKYVSTIFLRVIIGLIAVGVLGLLLWEPQIEGVNVHATNFEIYTDPFILLVYAGSIPFFLALYKAFRLLGYVGRNQAFTVEAVHALKMIKYCAMTIIGFVVAEEIIIMMTHGDDDAAGAVFMGFLIVLGSIIVTAAAGMFQQMVQNAVYIKVENELTV